MHTRLPSSLDSLKGKTLAFTVTPGRSGTALLAALLRESVEIEAAHEPPPRVNFVLRSFVAVPQVATQWLLTEKLPAIAERCRGPVYAETSHLFCKGLIEPLLMLDLRLKFIVLTRPAREVASSMFHMNVIPERTPAGRLVLLGPSDPGVLKIEGWNGLSDYQLCFWYAREIERRQRRYSAMFRGRRIPFRRIAMAELLDWENFQALAEFVIPGGGRKASEPRFREIARSNQNPRAKLVPAAQQREIGFDPAPEEEQVDCAIERARSAPVDNRGE